MVTQRAHLWLHIHADGRDVGSDGVDVDTLREDADTQGRDGNGARGNVDPGKAEVDGRDCMHAMTAISAVRLSSRP